MLKAIHASEDVHKAREKALRVGAKLRKQRMLMAHAPLLEKFALTLRRPHAEKA